MNKHRLLNGLVSGGLLLATLLTAPASTPTRAAEGAAGETPLALKPAGAVRSATVSAAPAVIPASAARQADLTRARDAGATGVDSQLSPAQVPPFVTLTGPTTGVLMRPHQFVASVSPVSATLPISFTWTATEQPPTVHNRKPTGYDTMDYSWGVTGTKVITVTAQNAAGSDMATHVIQIGESSLGVSISGPVTGTGGITHTFWATVSPPTTTLPITYTWHATDKSTVTHGDIMSEPDSIAYNWAWGGMKYITVTAENATGWASDTHAMEIVGDAFDSDGDGIPNSEECSAGPPCPDSDNDGTPDYLDTDSDDDGISDFAECSAGPPCPDSDNDGTPDYLDPLDLGLQVTISPTEAFRLVYTDTRGNLTVIGGPPGIVTDTTTLVFTPHATPTHAIGSGEGFAGHAFGLEAVRRDTPLPGLTFGDMISITIEYDDGEVTGIDENSLALYRWTGDDWQSIGAQPPESQMLDSGQNVLTAYLSRLSEFVMSGPLLQPVFYVTLDNQYKDNAIVGSWYVITNTSPFQATTVHDFYDDLGMVVYSDMQTIGPSSSLTRFLPTVTMLPDGYEGRVVVSADQPIAGMGFSLRRPPTGVSISGPATGTVGEVYSFTARVSPADTTLPVTYAWEGTEQSGISDSRGLSHTVTFSWPTEGSQTITVTASNSFGAVSETHSIAIAASTTAGDAYEEDDVCGQANAIPDDGTAQTHSFHDEGDEDWISFDATAGVTYVLEVRVPPESSADVSLELYDVCDGDVVDDQDNAFSADIRLKFKAPTSGIYYARLSNSDSSRAGPDVTYAFSVRRWDPTALASGLILVAGRLREADPLQANIHNITGALYDLVVAHGYDPERVQYLATDKSLPGYDAAATAANLQWSIINWAPDKLGTGGYLTLYVVDHGGYDKFYLDGVTNEKVTPQELDGWLDKLEEARPDVQVNVMVEACYSGSFIDWPQKVSQEKRVVVASTAEYALAYASQEGAFFSDSFMGALGQGMNLWQAFEEGRWAVETAHADQTPWLDGDGDGVPNEGGDAVVARRRTLFGAAADLWPPDISKVWVLEAQVEGERVIEAKVLDNLGVESVWAVIYPPSYQEPAPGEELTLETLQTVTLSPTQTADVYRAQVPGFDELGTYRVAVYAVDEDGWQARPEVIPVETALWEEVYLPLVMRR